jgi:hypothetical protein
MPRVPQAILSRSNEGTKIHCAAARAFWFAKKSISIEARLVAGWEIFWTGYTGTRVDVSRKHYFQVGATIRE